MNLIQNIDYRDMVGNSYFLIDIKALNKLLGILCCWIFSKTTKTRNLFYSILEI